MDPSGRHQTVRDRNDVCRSKVAAFTLIELLIVISIMVLLIGILLPSLNRAREDARRTVCLANLKHIGVGIASYATENNDRGPVVADASPTTNQSPRQVLSNATQTINLGRLWPQNLSDANVYHCPSQRVFEYSDDIEKLGTGMVAGSYAYAVHVPAGGSPILSIMRHLAVVSDDFTVVTPNDAGVGKFSHARGYNVLYSDGSATWYSDEDESIWKRKITWDDESDALNYQSLYSDSGVYISGGYRKRDIFKVWHSFCYSQPDPFY